MPYMDSMGELSIYVATQYACHHQGYNLRSGSGDPNLNFKPSLATTTRRIHSSY